MSQARGRIDERDSEGLLGLLVNSPILWGGAMSVGFYALVPHLPVHRALIERYFCSHPLEYATATLFFIGMAILGLKALRFRAESLAFDALDLPRRDEQSGADTTTQLEKIEDAASKVPYRLRGSALICRVRNICDYLHGRGSTGGLEEHMKYEAEMASEELHGSFALVRTITWAVPILGFLGTVIGITIAIANVTPEQLQTSLQGVISGLAVAFDTTALALFLSMVLVFGAFVVERTEQRNLARVEEFTLRRIGSLFPSDSAADPLLTAQQVAGEKLIERTEKMIEWQTELWSESIESLRERWSKAITNQQAAFDEALKESMRTTLSDHAHQLADIRQEFVGAYETVSARLSQNLESMLAAQREQADTTAEQLEQQWERIHKDMLLLRDDVKTGASEFSATCTEQVDRWHAQLSACTRALQDQLSEFERQGDILLRVVGQEEHLANLQHRLSQNLETLQAVETFQETLHNLSAAVHLLTARARKAA